MNSKLRLAHAQLGACVGVLTITIGYCLVQLPRLEETAEQANAKAGRTQTQVEALSGTQQKLVSGLDEANRRLIALGNAPVPVPKVTPSQPPDEFTTEEAAAVRLIVADQIAATPAKITQSEISQIARVAAALVPKPKDGKTPTAAELTPIVKVVLAQYCTGDKCVGKTGSDGKPGNQGEPGPGVTDEQLLAASQKSLAAYCALPEKPCQGTPGVKGADAPPPYSVVDMDCVGDALQSYWRIYLSNGTDQKTLTAKGPCRVGLDPN